MTLECSMLYVKDFARMRDFYAKALQTEPINTEWTENWAFFDTGGAGFALHAVPPASSENVSGTNRERSPVKLIFAVPNVTAERARLEGLGVTTLLRSWQDPAESCDCVDPEGNVFQIAARQRLPHLFGQA